MQENLHGLRDMIYWLICKYGKQKPDTSEGQPGGLSNNIALDISFGTIGHALILARAFKKVRTIRAFSSCVLSRGMALV